MTNIIAGGIIAINALNLLVDYVLDRLMMSHFVRWFRTESAARPRWHACTPERPANERSK
jgi:hypothetical protein